MEVPNTMWGFRSSSTLANIFLLLLVAMIFSVSHVSASKQFQNETDRLALLEFKKQIYNDPLGVLNSWNHSQHHCQWEGITCGTRHQRVIALTLRHKHFSGIISPLVGNLSFMRFIHLEENQFHGEIPQEFGRLFRLRVLNLPIFNSSAVVVISVAGNSFHGNLPTNIGLTLPVSQPWGKQILCQSTEDLDFIASLTNCSNLSVLSLSVNKFGGNMPKAMANFSNQLNEFYVGGNYLSGTIPEGFGNFVNLYKLGLEFNSFSGIIARDFGKLPNLQGLRLDHNDLSGQIVSTLCNNTSLYYLDLSFNQFEGGNILDNVLMNCQNLQYVDISQNNFTGIISPHFLETHSSLIYMGLSENSFTGSLPPEVGKLIHLADFNVSHNQLVGDIPMSLADCSNLENLFMQANFFQGTIPPNLASLKSIQQLDLSSNNLTGPIPSDQGEKH
ncbi:LRR receptor-like serine/threonine-protein kinase EFR [Coffea eugenioides]|uniref:LRR receptor-like serine/threonine-protein kinase EFR n=1 Tax=Coffea eugenioides TaxID=49369 RepID=UPI000F612D9F|nr:LRR receptor-like serine/threonine-protein kinase EFR [Coffea eugenioides]XP_027166296.1 LRR receptor-like serine/threonine-protein kinase EFR [Coffea eugenioides]